MMDLSLRVDQLNNRITVFLRISDSGSNSHGDAFRLRDVAAPMAVCPCPGV